MIHEHRNTRMRNRNLYVLTGGPGGGKSTVLDILDGMGYHTVREAGRKIIRSQAETGGNAVPWADTGPVCPPDVAPIPKRFREARGPRRTLLFSTGG